MGLKVVENDGRYSVDWNLPCTFINKYRVSWESKELIRTPNNVEDGTLKFAAFIAERDRKCS